MDVTFDMVEAYAQYRYTGDMRLLRDIFQQKTYEERMPLMDWMARAAAKDDEVLLDHILKGGQWIVVASERYVAENRLMRAGISKKDIYAKKHLIVVLGDASGYLAIINNPSGWKMLVHASARYILDEKRVYNDLAIHPMELRSGFCHISDILGRAKVKGIEVVIENWT